MKKFGIGKKPSAGGSNDDDSTRSALFGSRKGKPTAPGANPYASATGNPYHSNSSSGGGGYGGMGQPPAYDGGGLTDQQRSEKSAVPIGGYSSGGGGGNRYGNTGQYGAQGGYGTDRYGGGTAAPSGGRPGGYGGLGPASNDRDADAGRDALFGGAAQRYQQQQQQKPGLPSGPRPGGAGPGGYDASQSGGYGAYQDRQLTAEEEEEEDVTAAKQQIRQMKQEDVSSTRNALRMAAQAEQSGMDTLNRLGAQGERIHNTERHLDLASNQNRIASDKAKALKQANSSMFAVHVNNPFTSSSRREARDQAIMDNHARERDAREATRQAAYNSRSRNAEFQKQVGASRGAAGPGGPQKNLAERSKYQFEADSEDEEMENEIDSNLDLLHGAAGRLGHLAKAMGREVDEQNVHIDRIAGKTDGVEDQITMNRAKLDRIR